MKITVLGCGNAFGSGGRLQTSFHLALPQGDVLIDCGATALIAMERSGLDPKATDTIVISHLHGDHFAGLVWWLLHAKFVAERSRPLTLAGPPGLRQRILAAMDALYPGVAGDLEHLNLEYVELEAGTICELPQISLTPFEVIHPSGAPSFALRITAGERTISFSGDTEWTDELFPAAAGSDLFICECSTYDMQVPSHLNWVTLEKKLQDISADRIMLTHMNNSMFAKRHELSSQRIVFAEDGMVIDI